MNGVGIFECYVQVLGEKDTLRVEIEIKEVIL